MMLMKREEIAASRERQQQELQEKAREKDELVRQRRLARAIEEEQRTQSNVILHNIPSALDNVATLCSSKVHDKTIASLSSYYYYRVDVFESPSSFSI